VKGKILCPSQLEEVLTKAVQEQRREDGKLLECVRIMDAEDVVTAYPEGVGEPQEEEEDEPEEAAEPPEEPDRLPEPEDTPLDE
jgi:HEPN domain-containing protein